MKKLIAILMVLAIVAGFAFAADPATVNTGKQRITLETDVREAVPQFLFQGSLTSYTADLVNGKVVTTNENSFDGAELTNTAVKTNASIADANIVAYFIISQNAAKYVDGTTPDPAYARTQKTIEFTFAIGKLIQQDVASPKSVDGYLVANSAVKADAATYQVGGDTYTNKITNSVDATTQKFTAAYDGRVDNGQEIGRFQAQWDQDPTVPNGVYKADITLTIAVQ